MKKLFGLVATLVAILSVVPVHAVTVWYQPTSYPLKRCAGLPGCSGGNMPQGLNVVHSWSGWFGSVYNTTLVQDDKLQIGGWGDAYTSLIRFDLTGLPTSVNNAYLYLYALPSGAANASQVSWYPITSEWNTSTVGWNNFPSTGNGYYIPGYPSVNAWNGYYITPWYNDWKSGVRPDKGILIWPDDDDYIQRFDKFVSGRALSPNDGRRPILRLDFTPSFQPKMPLPRNAAWLVTNEVGGYECMGQNPLPDQFHQDVTGNYFSIDISWKNIYTGGGSSPYGEFNTPILAVAGGKVTFAGGGTTTGNPNGYYVIIDHDGDGNVNTGFSTRYLHLKNPPARKNGTLLVAGNFVNQGDQIGIMGTTGKDSSGNATSTGAHLHLGFRHNNSGLSTVSELTRVVMDGWILKSFQTECNIDSNGVPTAWIRHYTSTMVPTGN